MASNSTLALARKIASHSSNLLDTFILMDESNTGTITRSDLASSIHDLYNITLSPAQLDALCLSFGISGSTSDSVNYSKFVDVVRDLATLQPLTSSSYGAGNDLHRDTLADHPWDGATF